MPVKMRLARHGRKRYAYYHIVIADSRAPRDGRYIERIGMYNPNTNPATIDLDFDKAYDWLTKGAQPTDTVRSILSYKGVLYKKHLMGGVQKGAFNEEEAERRLEKWLNEKEAKIQAKKESIIGEDSVTAKKLLEAETRKKEEKAAAIAAKNAELAEEAKTAAQEETATESAPGENDVADTEKEVVDVPPRKETTDEGSEEKALKDEESKATAEGGSDNSEDKAGESSEREGNEESEEKK